MTKFYYGFCSFPHGGWAVTGLIATSLLAFAATLGGLASCRFMYIDYTTDRGDFSDFFRDPTADGEPILQRVGAGLFTWLEPFTITAEKIDDSGGGGDVAYWTEGQCSGYSEGQRTFFSDTLFEVSRIFAILSVLGGITIVLAIFFLSCLSLRRFQIWMLSTILGLISIFVGLTFIVFFSKLCNDLVSYQNESYTTQCTIDQGGLLVIAASIFWIIACIISIVYVKDPKRDLGIGNGEITNVFDARQERRYQRDRERRLKSEINRERRKQHREQRRNNNIESLSSKSNTSNASTAKS